MYLLLQALLWGALFLIAYTYLLYPLILLLTQKRAIPCRREEGLSPTVTMIVSAYNEEKVIGEKLENSSALEYPEGQLEVIVASDGSTDNTGAVIREQAAGGVRHIVFDERSGKANVLNNIIPLASGEIVVLSDANTMYRRDAIRKLVRNFADPSVGCVCGKLLLRKPARSSGGELEGIYWRYENFLKEMEGRRGALPGANGGIYAFRKTLFKPVPSTTVVEDFVIPMNILAAGKKVVYEPEAVAFEDTSKSMADEQVRKVRIGAGAYQALVMTLPMLNPRRGFASFAYWSHKVIRWLVPFLIITVLAANVLLLGYRRWYMYLYMAQGLFYSMVFVGLVSSRSSDSRLKVFNLSYYLIAMNICLFLGFFRFIAGAQKVTWQKAGR